MKKTIIITLLLLAVFCILITVSVPSWNSASKWIQEYNYLLSLNKPIEIATDLRLAKEGITHHAIYGSLCLLGALMTLVALILTAIYNFPVFKPLVDKLNAKCAVRKAQRAEKAKANKQARIEQLQAELDELKKDE